MKKLITAFIATLTLIITIPANAGNLKNTTIDVPTLAILDTALDTSIPLIKSRLIGEVCILDWASCYDKTKFMVGTNASMLPPGYVMSRDMSHGTQMASIAIANNPNLNILFVRIIGSTSSGTRQTTSVNTVPNALKWVYENKDKYNIKAISMSQGHHNLLKSTNYCPVTNVDYWVDWFGKSNIPLFFPSGNGRDYLRIDWPACVPGSIAVGGVESYDYGLGVSFNSNYDRKLLDIFAPINSSVILPGGFNGTAYGTSVSVQIAASKWISLSQAKPTLTMQQLLDLIKRTGTYVTNSVKSDGVMINLESALNG